MAGMKAGRAGVWGRAPVLRMQNAQAGKRENPLIMDFCTKALRRDSVELIFRGNRKAPDDARAFL